MPDIDKRIVEKDFNYISHVFDAYIYKRNSSKLIGRCEATSDSVYNVATEMVEKRGGSANAILWTILANKTATATLTNLDFSEDRIALQANEKFVMGDYTIYGRTAKCKVTESAGKKVIELPEAPAEKTVSIASGSSFFEVPIDADTPKIVDVTNYVGADDNDCLDVVYAALVRSEQLDIRPDTPPAVIKLVYRIPVRKGKGGAIVKWITITMEDFQLDGNMEISGNLGDTASMSISGTALASGAGDCSGNATQSLGKINIEHVGEDAYRVAQLSTNPEYEIELGSVDNIIVYALMGSDETHEMFPVTDECTYTSSDTGVVTVKTDDPDYGEITGVSAGTATITITHKSGRSITTEVTVV